MLVVVPFATIAMLMEMLEPFKINLPFMDELEALARAVVESWKRFVSEAVPQFSVRIVKRDIEGLCFSPLKRPASVTDKSKQLDAVKANSYHS